MTLTERERVDITRRTLEANFPGTNIDVLQRAQEVTLKFFSSGYSPVPEEWDVGQTGSGTGCSLSDYAIYHGYRLTRKKPATISDEILGRILLSANTY